MERGVRKGAGVDRGAMDVRVQRSTAGKKGKVVSKITGLTLDQPSLKTLTKALKVKVRPA